MDYFYLGEVIQFAFNFVPYYYLLCDGATVQISEYGALFNLIGTTYGGDGTTNFKLPDFSKATAFPGMKYYICTNGVYPAQG
jgi:microcystin-dependent protein